MMNVVAKAEKKRGSGDGRFLALIPVLVGVLLAALLFPHDAAPADVPLPNLDVRLLSATERADDARAARAASGLPAEVRALGEAIRAFNTTEWKDPPRAPWPELRVGVDDARKLALDHQRDKGGEEGLLDLRAVQLVRFLDEVRAWRKTGKESEELAAVGGSFIRRMTIAGYVSGTKLALDDRELRVAFKLKWNAVARLEDRPAFQPTLDEMRALYTFYLLHPHAAEGAREMIAAARKNARTQADCEALEAGEQIAIEQWRLDKIDKLAQLDASYPATYARGVELYRVAKFDESARAFEEWLRVHPDGPLTLRARNHLRAAIAASRAR
jgi:hypothetical protein